MTQQDSPEEAQQHDAMEHDLIQIDRLPVDMSRQQIEMIREPTPKIMVKSVRKPGGTFNYIPVGYVVDRLNMVFNHRWTFEVVREWQHLEQKQIVVLGRLQVQLGDGQVLRKENYGGAEIKCYKAEHKTHAGLPLNLANDLKAAAADALKKCASMLGIGLDVYAPVLDEYEKLEDVSEKMNEEELTKIKPWLASIRDAKNKQALLTIGQELAKVQMNNAQRSAVQDEFMSKLSTFENHAR